jgi:hypothetical protein
MEDIRHRMKTVENNLEKNNYSGKVLVTYTYEVEAKGACENLGRPMRDSWIALLFNILLYRRPKS